MRFKKLGTLLSEWERTEAKPSVLRAETEERNEEVEEFISQLAWAEGRKKLQA